MEILYRIHEITFEKTRAICVGFFADCRAIRCDACFRDHLPDPICLGRFVPWVWYDARLRERIAAGFSHGVCLSSAMDFDAAARDLRSSLPLAQVATRVEHWCDGSCACVVRGLCSANDTRYGRCSCI